jgi:hypothetical protein
MSEHKTWKELNNALVEDFSNAGSVAERFDKALEKNRGGHVVKAPLVFAAKAPYKSDTAAAYVKITRGATLENVRAAVTGAVDAMVSSWTAKKTAADIAVMVVDSAGRPDFLTLKYRLTSEGLDSPGAVTIEREWADEDPVEKSGLRTPVEIADFLYDAARLWEIKDS